MGYTAPPKSQLNHRTTNEKRWWEIVPISEQNSSGVLTIPIDKKEESMPTIFTGSFGWTVTNTHELPTRKEKVEGVIFLLLMAPSNLVEECLKSDIIVKLVE